MLFLTLLRRGFKLVGRVLYKYRSINDFTKNIIKDNELYYAPISGLNDPNEGMVKTITDEQAKEFVRKTKENQLEGFVTGMFMASLGKAPFYGLNERGQKKLQNNIRNKKTLDRKYKYVSNFIEEKTGRSISNPESFLTSINKHIKNVGILSLSEDPLNHLMWAHYGENHQGIAIGISNFNDEDYKQVVYNSTSQIPEIDLTKNISVVKMYAGYNKYEIGFNDPNLQKVLLTKTDPWKYEREWRGIKEKHGAHPIEGKIVEIIFGLNCDELKRDEIRKLVIEANNPNIKFKEIYKKPDSYDLFVRDCSLTVG